MKQTDFGQIKFYLIIRKDLSPGLQLAQVSHGSNEFAAKDPKAFIKWYVESKYTVVLHAEDLKHLYEIKKSLIKEGCLIYPFYEPDLGNELTCIAINPYTDSKKVTKRLPLAFSKGGNPIAIQKRA